jgi:uncharacterized protein YbcI
MAVYFMEDTMGTTASLPTRGQLERTLSQQIQALYREQLGHRPGKVSCQIFNEKMVVVIEDSITQPEQVLAQEGQSKLAEEVRAELDSAIQPQLKDLIEKISGVKVADLLSDATLESGRTGIIVVFEEAPTVRNTSSNSKTFRDDAQSKSDEA